MMPALEQGCLVTSRMQCAGGMDLLINPAPAAELPACGVLMVCPRVRPGVRPGVGPGGMQSWCRHIWGYGAVRGRARLPMGEVLAYVFESAPLPISAPLSPTNRICSAFVSYKLSDLLDVSLKTEHCDVMAPSCQRKVC